MARARIMIVEADGVDSESLTALLTTLAEFFSKAKTLQAIPLETVQGSPAQEQTPSASSRTVPPQPSAAASTDTIGASPSAPRADAAARESLVRRDGEAGRGGLASPAPAATDPANGIRRGGRPRRMVLDMGTQRVMTIEQAAELAGVKKNTLMVGLAPSFKGKLIGGRRFRWHDGKVDPHAARPRGNGMSQTINAMRLPASERKRPADLEGAEDAAFDDDERDKPPRPARGCDAGESDQEVGSSFNAAGSDEAPAVISELLWRAGPPLTQIPVAGRPVGILGEAVQATTFATQQQIEMLTTREPAGMSSVRSAKPTASGSEG